MKKELPRGWEWKRLGEIARVGAGNGAPQGEQYFADGKYSFVRTQDVGRKKATNCLVNTTDKVNDLAVKKFNLKMWAPQTLLIPKSGASTFLNHRALLGSPSYVTSHLATVTAGNNLLPKYLYFWSLTIDAKQLTHDVNYPSLKLSEIENAKIPLPPLETQRKIVTVLEKAETTKEIRTQADELTNQLLRSVFFEMFGDPIKNPMNFDIIKLKTVFSKNKSGTKCGPFGSALKKHEYVDDGIPVWIMDNIQKNKFNENGCLFITEEKYTSLLSYSVEKGDILISRAGTVGKMCVATPSMSKSIIHSNIIRLSLNQSKIQPIFFTSLMEFCKDRIGRLKTGVDGSYTFMNTGILNDLEIPLPPMSLQNKFAQIVEKIEEMKQSQKLSHQEIDNLFNRIIQKAFIGELVA